MIALSVWAQSSYSKVTPSTLVACSSRESEWSSEIELSESGVATMSLSHGSSAYSCSLKMLNFELKPRAKVPVVWLEFDRRKCSPEIAPPKLDHEIQTHLTLKITPGKSKGKFTGLFQWQRYAQPTECAVKVYNRDGMRSAYERWKAKAWGL